MRKLNYDNLLWLLIWYVSEEYITSIFRAENQASSRRLDRHISLHPDSLDGAISQKVAAYARSILRSSLLVFERSLLRVSSVLVHFSCFYSKENALIYYDLFKNESLRYLIPTPFWSRARTAIVGTRLMVQWPAQTQFVFQRGSALCVIGEGQNHKRGLLRRPAGFAGLSATPCHAGHSCTTPLRSEVFTAVTIKNVLFFDI
jgi:hypothetical protein